MERLLVEMVQADVADDKLEARLHRKFDQYHLWFSAQEHTGWDALLIVDYRRHFKRARRYQPLFEKMDPQAETIQIFRQGRPAHHIEVYKYYGFRGKFEN